MYVVPLINEATFNHRSPFSIYKLTRGLPKKKILRAAIINKKLQTNYKVQQKRQNYKRTDFPYTTELYENNTIANNNNSSRRKKTTSCNCNNNKSGKY